MVNVVKPPFATEIERSARTVELVCFGLCVVLCTVELFRDGPWIWSGLAVNATGGGYVVFAYFRGKRRIRAEASLLCWQCSYPKGPHSEACPECGQRCSPRYELAIWRTKYGPRAF